MLSVKGHRKPQFSAPVSLVSIPHGLPVPPLSPGQSGRTQETGEAPQASCNARRPFVLSLVQLTIWLAALPLILSSTACNEQHSDTANPVARASLGTISPSQIWGAPAASLQLQIGAVEGDSSYLLAGTLGGARLRNGDIVIATNWVAELRFYDFTGHYLRSAGRLGHGPGEFGDIGGQLVRAPGDTLLVGLSLEPNVFSPDGRFIRQLRVDREALVRRLPRNHALAAAPYVLPDGGFLVKHRCIDCLPQRGAVRVPVHYRYVPPAGGRWDSVGTVPGREDFDSHTAAAQGVAGVLMPFPRSDAHAFGGEPLTIYIGDTGSRVIHSYMPSTGERTSFHVALQATPMASADLQDFADRLLQRYPEMREQLRRTWALAPPPKSYPFYASLSVDRDGNLWIQHILTVKATRTIWSVYDRHGVKLGELAIPARLRALDIGWDYLLTEFRDSLDVPFARLYRLVR